MKIGVNQTTTAATNRGADVQLEQRSGGRIQARRGASRAT